MNLHARTIRLARVLRGLESPANAVEVALVDGKIRGHAILGARWRVHVVGNAIAGEIGGAR